VFVSLFLLPHYILLVVLVNGLHCYCLSLFSLLIPSKSRLVALILVSSNQTDSFYLLPLLYFINKYINHKNKPIKTIINIKGSSGFGGVCDITPLVML